MQLTAVTRRRLVGDEIGLAQCRPDLGRELPGVAVPDLLVGNEVAPVGRRDRGAGRVPHLDQPHPLVSEVEQDDLVVRIVPLLRDAVPSVPLDEYSPYWDREVIDFPAGQVVASPWDGREPVLFEARKLYDGTDAWDYNKRRGGWSGFVLIEAGKGGPVARVMASIEAVVWWRERRK